MDLSVRRVLFDAGGVLTRPVGGRWNPRYDFEGIVLAHHPEAAIDLGYHGAALVRAGDPATSVPVIRSLDDLA